MTRRFFYSLLLLATMAGVFVSAEEPQVFIYKNDQEQWGVADRSGKTVLPAKFGKIYPYYTITNGVMGVYFWATYDKFAYEGSPSMMLDRNGKALCEPVYNLCIDSVMNTILGFISKDAVLALREEEKGKKVCVILYTDGLAVNTGLLFDEAIFCGTNLVKIVRNKKTFLWNLDKRYIERAPSETDKFRTWFDSYCPTADPPAHKKVASYHARIQEDENGKRWYVDAQTGLPLTKEKYDELRAPDWLDWWDGVFPAKLNGKWGIFKLDGTVVLPPEYVWIGREPIL